MSVLRRLLITSLLLLLMTACTDRNDSRASHAEALLSEAEYAIQAREFSSAEKSIQEGLEKLDEILLTSPANIDYLLLRARAKILLFQARNVLILENATERPRSLVKLPQVTEYKDLNTTALSAAEDLKKALNDRENLNPEQRIAALGMLASIYRLSDDTAMESDRRYQQAILAAKKALRDLQNEKKAGANQSYREEQLEQQLKELMLARVEVNLLLEDWTRALALLEEMQGGKDLQYFATQFEIMEQQLQSLYQQLQEQKTSTEGTREGKLIELLKKARMRRQSKTAQVAGLSPVEIELIHVDRNLTHLKNNLIYRALCYQHLASTEELAKTRRIFQSFYPDIDARLEKAFKTINEQE